MDWTWTINISYCRGTQENPDRSKESYFYTINHDGTVSVEQSNEVLNLNDIVHMFGIISTIIRDIYGDYNSREVMEKYINSITSKQEK